MPRLLLVLGLVSLVAIGCGGGDDGDSSSSSNGSDSIARADKICKDAQAEQQKLLDGSNSNSKDPKVLAGYLGSSLAQTKKTDAQLKELTPPANYVSEWKAWIAGLVDQAKSTEELIDTVKPGMKSGVNSAYLKALNAKIAQQVKTNKLATGVGLKVCSQNSGM